MINLESLIRKVHQKQKKLIQNGITQLKGKTK